MTLKKQFSLFIAMIAVTRLSAASPTPSGLIVGGDLAARDEFPYIVSLQEGFFGHFCGGSLIASDWVLTAAHCAESADFSKVRVVAGLHSLDDTDGTETFRVSKVVVHPRFNPDTLDFDYALLKLNGKSGFQPAEVNNSPIPIPDDGGKGPVVTIAGWGSTAEGGDISNDLLKINLPLVSAARCKVAFPGKITDEMLCAGYDDGKKDACQGDSGGPLILQSAKGTPVLAGVVSWGDGCAKPGKYGIYADVSKAAPWISQTMAASGS